MYYISLIFLTKIILLKNYFLLVIKHIQVANEKRNIFKDKLSSFIFDDLEQV